MKFSKSIDCCYLSDLAEKIKTLPSDEAASLLFEGSTTILFAGFPEIAYQGFIKLTQGELKVSEASVLADPLKAIVPALCYLMNISCPSILESQEIPLHKLEKYIENNQEKYEKISGIDRWFHIEMPSGDWTEDFLHEITHPAVDTIGNNKFQAYRFLQDLHRVISQSCVNQGNWQEASRWLKVFEEVINAWEINCQGYIEQEILVFGIRTYFSLGDINNADRYIQKWWQCSDREMISRLYLITHLPKVMKRISEGVLRNEINISKKQAQEFLESVDRRHYISESIEFIPRVEDWKDFLEKWNKAAFDNIDGEYRESYELRYPKVFKNKSCLCAGAMEAEIAELEKRLQTRLPLSYKNFLLASNGFKIINEFCELYGTDRIQWFIEENEEWVKAWDCSDLVDDEKYFQYGEHQDCVWIRGQYLKTALQISSTEDGYVYLLNPQIKDSRNEWEAWDFGNKLPGAYRYRSFWEMMQEIYKRNFDS